MSGIWLVAIGMLGQWIYNVWVWCQLGVYFVPYFRPGVDLSKVRGLKTELRPFALPGLIAAFVILVITGDAGWSDRLFFGLNLLGWWLWRKDEDDDDRWKRRQQRLADKVAEVGGRLQVVPAGAS